jgi:hypothetical protein
MIQRDVQSDEEEERNVKLAVERKAELLDVENSEEELIVAGRRVLTSIENNNNCSMLINKRTLTFCLELKNTKGTGK